MFLGTPLPPLQVSAAFCSNRLLVLSSLETSLEFWVPLKFWVVAKSLEFTGVLGFGGV